MGLARNCVPLAIWLLLCLPLSAVSAQSIAGHWEGTLTREKADLVVSLDFAKQSNDYVGRFTSLSQKVMAYPLDKVTVKSSQGHFELAGELVFDGTISGDTLNGEFRDPKASGTFALKRASALEPPYKTEEVRFSNGPATLTGTLLMPQTKGPHPAVIFLQGSGAETRWGTSYFLADTLAETVLPLWSTINEARAHRVETGERRDLRRWLMTPSRGGECFRGAVMFVANKLEFTVTVSEDLLPHLWHFAPRMSPFSLLPPALLGSTIKPTRHEASIRGFRRRRRRSRRRATALLAGHLSQRR